VLLWLAQGLTPGDCIITGLCGINLPPPGPPSGLMFIAVGLVLGGALGLRFRHRR
jgi:hypothetical protein